jgi:hypothetical protein
MEKDRSPVLLPDKRAAMLVVIDFQEKLVPLTEDHAEVETNLRRLLKLAEIFEIPALVSEQYVKGLGPTRAPVREAAKGIATAAPLGRTPSFAASRRTCASSRPRST